MKLKRLTESVSSNLNPGIDAFLQNVAQMTGAITYTDIATFGDCAQPHQINAIESLRKMWDEAAQYDDEADLMDLGNHVAAIVRDVKCDDNSELSLTESADTEKDLKAIIGLYCEKLDVTEEGDEIDLRIVINDQIPDKEKGHKEILDTLRKNGYTVLREIDKYNSLVKQHLSFITISAKDADKLKEDLGDLYRKVFDKPASTKTQQRWEDELNGEMGEISRKRRRELERKFARQRDYEERHPEQYPDMHSTPDTATTEEEPMLVESKYKPHTQRLLKMIGSDLAEDMGSDLEEDIDVRDCTNKLLDYVVEMGIAELDSPAYRLIANLLHYMSEDEVGEFCDDYEYDFDSDDLNESLLMEAPRTGIAKNIFGRRKNVNNTVAGAARKGSKVANKRYDKLAKQALALVKKELTGKGDYPNYLYWVDGKALSFDEYQDLVPDDFSPTSEDAAKILNAIVTDASGRRILRRGAESFYDSPIAASATNKKLKYVWENGMLISAAEAGKKPGMQADEDEEDPKDKDTDPKDTDPKDDDEDPRDDEVDDDSDSEDEDPKDEDPKDADEDPKDKDEDPKDKDESDDKKPASGDDPFKERNKGVTKKIIDKFRKLAMATGLEVKDAFGKVVDMDSSMAVGKITPESLIDYTIKVKGKELSLTDWLVHAMKNRVITESFVSEEFKKELSEAVLYKHARKSSVKESVLDDEYHSVGSVRTTDYLQEAFKPVAKAKLPIDSGDITEDDAFFLSYR